MAHGAWFANPPAPIRPSEGEVLSVTTVPDEELALLKQLQQNEQKAKAAVVVGLPPPRFREYKDHELEPDVLETPDQVHQAWTESEYDTEAEVLSVEQKTKRKVIMYRGHM